MALEMCKMLHLSTAHVTPAVAEALDRHVEVVHPLGQRSDLAPCIAERWSDYGWFICVKSTGRELMSKPPQECLAFAEGIGINWIQFDRDCEPIADLPTYDRELEDGTTQGLRVLASSCPGNRVYYAVVQAMTSGDDPGEFFAVICLVKWSPRSPSDENFGYKDMSESAGPLEAECPADILGLLTTTDNEYALDWRRRCLARLRVRSRAIRNGDRVRLASPLRFIDGETRDEFIVEKHGRTMRFRDAQGGSLCHINHFMDRRWVIVPAIRVHKTVFA